MKAVRVKSFVIAALLLGIFSSGAWAGWATQETGITQDLNSIYFVSAGLGFAAGNNGTFLKTTSGGTTWEAVTIGSANFQNVFFPSSQEGYLLGDNSRLYLCTNNGSTTTEISLTTEASMVYRRGSAYGNYRALVASRGAAAGSYIYISSEGEASWQRNTTLLQSVEAKGILLTAPIGTSPYTVWTWGRFFAGPEAGNNVIMKNGNIVWRNASQAVRDLFFADTNVGCAVGDSGLVLQTQDGGNSWDSLDVGVSENLNGVFFITKDFGWVVGDNRAISFTKDFTSTTGSSWAPYTLDNAIDIKSIFVKLVPVTTSVKSLASLAAANNCPVLREFSTYALVHAYICGTGGQVLKLSSPTFGNVTPKSKPRGWTGTIEVTGSGFIRGAAVTLSGSNVTTVNTSYESSSKLIAQILISPSATPDARDVMVENPDATATSEARGFTILTGEVAVTYHGIMLDNNAYFPPIITTEVRGGVPTTEMYPITINSQPHVTYEVRSANGFSKAGINARILTYYNGSYIFSYIPETSLSWIAQPNRIQVDYDVPETLPSGEVVEFMLYAEDINGNVSLESLTVAVSKPAGSNPPDDPRLKEWPGTTQRGGAVYFNRTNAVDFDRTPTVPAMLILSPGTAVKSVTVKIVDFTGKLVYSKRLVSTGNEYVTKINWNINKTEMAPYLSAGIYTVLAYNDTTGKLLARNLMVISPQR